MKKLLKSHYGLELLSMEKSDVGAGSDTYFVTCTDGKYVVKYPASSEINHPDAEPELCEYLLAHGIPVCQFLRNKDGHFLTMDESGRQFHVQRFIEGKMYDLNTAPDWLLTESARMLGKIHAALRDYQELPVGIGADFFKYMTPDRALLSYKKSLNIAESRNDAEIITDLRYRIDLMQRFPVYEFDLDRLTCCATHGDYFISQIICGDEKINAIIDWTTACIHPVVWEIVRSFVYAAPSCKEGQIDMDEFLRYVAEYRKFAPLNEYDLLCIARLFYYQIAVCDYYGQYYASTADNRHIYLHQAVFSTKLLRWLEEHVETLTAKLLTAFKEDDIMEKTASQIQKERIKELEAKADALIAKCDVATLTSINEKGYPRTCVLSIYKADGFSDVFFVTSKRSALNGKATHFEANPKASVCYFLGGDSVTLIGNVEFIEDRVVQESIWKEADRKFFKKGLDDPKFRLIHFHTIEATFWIEGKFRTCKYK